MADAEDIQPLVCDNGTGMVKVCVVYIFKKNSLLGCFKLLLIVCLERGTSSKKEARLVSLV